MAVEAGAAPLARQVGWPGLRSYELMVLDLPSILAAATADGYEQAVLLAADAPDLPGMVIAKLLRPLSTRPVSVAPTTEFSLAAVAALPVVAISVVLW